MACGVLFILLVLAFMAFTSVSKPAPFPPLDRARPGPPADGAALPDRALLSDIFEGAFARRDARAISSYYVEDAFLQDSWGTSIGKEEVFRYYDTQFHYASDIRLEITDYLQDGNSVVITVNAVQQSPGVLIRLPAIVHLEFKDRKITYQREYWDAFAYLDGVPVLNRLFGALRYYATARHE